MAVICEMIRENITLTGANAYTEKVLTFMANEIGKTKKNSSDIKVMLVWGIGLEIISGFDAVGVTDQDEWFIQFCTNSETAEITTIDKDLFWKKKKIRQFETGGVGYDKDVTPIYWFDKPLAYFKPRVWIAGGSTGLAAALNVDFVLYHTYGYVSKEVYNRVIARKI